MPEGVAPKLEGGAYDFSKHSNCHPPPPQVSLPLTTLFRPYIVVLVRTLL